MRLVIRWFITAVALLITARFLPGIRIEGTSAWIAVAAMAAILGLVNAFVRPLLRFLSCGLIVLTLGLFLLVINAVTLELASWIAVNWFDIGFHVDGFWPAFWGSIVVSIISILLSLFVDDVRD